MKVLVLGASGYIGKRLLSTLKSTSWASPVGASRKREQDTSANARWIQVDSRDVTALTAALKGFDAVVNCVAGDARSISEGAHGLVRAALAAQCPRIIHLSTMSVYGSTEGIVHEDALLKPDIGWYGQAKCDAEIHVGDFVRQGGEAVVLRPGCVFGPGSHLWVGRVARWLHARRLGDLGLAGDGWSNLVHINDVCQAVPAALRIPVLPDKFRVFNLAAPDSPRWNDYFVDLAIEIKATPVRRKGPSQLQFDAWLAGPPLKVAQSVFNYLGNQRARLPEPISPGLLRLWRQHIFLDSTSATKELGLGWTPYAFGLKSSAAWFCEKKGPCDQVCDEAKCTH